MKKYTIGFLSLVVITANIQAGYFDRASATAYDWLGRTPLYAGYQYSEEQKNEARARIKQLEKEQLDIVTDEFQDTGYATVAADKSSKPLSADDKQRLEEINNELYQLKLITGDVWSTRRRVVLGAMALAGFAALGYKYLIPDEISRLKKEYEDLVSRTTIKQDIDGVWPSKAEIDQGMELQKVLISKMGENTFDSYNKQLDHDMYDKVQKMWSDIYQRDEAEFQEKSKYVRDMSEKRLYGADQVEITDQQVSFREENEDLGKRKSISHDDNAWQNIKQKHQDFMEENAGNVSEQEKRLKLGELIWQEFGGDRD